MKLKHKLILGVVAGAVQVLALSLMTDQSLPSVLFQGAFLGVSFGWGMPYIMERMAKRMERKITMELTTGEENLHEGRANLFRKLEGVGGKLFLTNQRLHFKAHKMNVQSEPLSIPLDQIDEVSTFKTTKLFDLENGLGIKVLDGQEYRFVVNEREDWIDALLQSGCIHAD